MSEQKTNPINKETDICDIGLSTRSYNALTQAGIEKVFEEYLSQHCFKVNWSNTVFKSYGIGWMNAIELAITI